MNRAERRAVAPQPKKPHVTRRREFKAWLIISLLAAGVELPPDPSYKDLQLALEKFPPFKLEGSEGAVT